MTQRLDAFGEYREKRPGSIADFGLNWAPFLAGDTIETSSWEVPAGITQDGSPAATYTDTTTTLWLSAGTAGEEYALVNTITTAGGRTWLRPLRIKVVEVLRAEPAFSYSDLVALRNAYKQGVNRVRYGTGSDQKEVEYRSLADMKRLLDELGDEIAGTVVTPLKSSCSLASHRRG